MKWTLPPIAKIYEALGAIGDNRVEVFGNTAKCYSSSGGKYYSIKYIPESKTIYVNDNASYYVGYLGYPAIAFLMKKGLLPFEEKFATAYAGINWKDINKKNKNDFDRTVKEVSEGLELKGVQFKKVETFAKKVLIGLKKLDLEKPKVLEKPPEGY